MDEYYRDQISMPYYRAHIRQRGRGIGAIAGIAGGIAVPLLKKYFLPAAKRVAIDLAHELKDEAIHVFGGKTTPKQAFKRAVKKTARKQLGGGIQKRNKKVIIRKKVISKRKVGPRSRVDILGNVRK